MPYDLKDLPLDSFDSIGELEYGLLKIAPGSHVSVRVFTSYFDKISLHYENQPGFGYIQCPKDRCPYCFLADSLKNNSGYKATEHYLLPVFSLKDNNVEILRITDNEKVGALFPQIKRLVRTPDIEEKIVYIDRIDNSKFRVKPSPVSVPPSESQKLAVSVFAEKFKKGAIDLKSLFPRYSPEFLIENLDYLKDELTGLGYFTVSDENSDTPSSTSSPTDEEDMV